MIMNNIIIVIKHFKVNSNLFNNCQILESREREKKKERERKRERERRKERKKENRTFIMTFILYLSFEFGS